MKSGGDVLLARVTDDEEKQQKGTLLSRRLQTSDFCKVDVIILFVFCYTFLRLWLYMMYY